MQTYMDCSSPWINLIKLPYYVLKLSKLQCILITFAIVLPWCVFYYHECFERKADFHCTYFIEWTITLLLLSLWLLLLLLLLLNQNTQDGQNERFIIWTRHKMCTFSENFTCRHIQTWSMRGWELFTIRSSKVTLS